MSVTAEQLNLSPVVAAAPLSLLIVDDHGPIRRALTARCEHAGYRVTTASDSGTALAAALHAAPQAAVLDINLPGLNGFELAERLLALNPQCQITFVTASQDPQFKERAEALGVRAVLRKPFDSAALLEHLSTCFR